MAPTIQSGDIVLIEPDPRALCEADLLGQVVVCRDGFGRMRIHRLVRRGPDAGPLHHPRRQPGRATGPREAVRGPRAGWWRWSGSWARRLLRAVRLGPSAGRSRSPGSPDADRRGPGGARRGGLQCRPSATASSPASWRADAAPGAPTKATFEVTRRCPLTCAHCYNNLPTGDRRGPGHRAERGRTPADARRAGGDGLPVAAVHRWRDLRPPGLHGHLPARQAARIPDHAVHQRHPDHPRHRRPAGRARGRSASRSPSTATPARPTSGSPGSRVVRPLPAGHRSAARAAPATGAQDGGAHPQPARDPGHAALRRRAGPDLQVRRPDEPAPGWRGRVRWRCACDPRRR